MLSKFVFILFVTTIEAQIDGEFWWLNNKLAEIKGANPEPKFEEISEFETDEGDKVVFNDNNSADQSNDVTKWNIRFQDRTQLKWPSNHKPKSTDLQSATSKPEITNGDVLDFKFPDSDKFAWRDVLNTSRRTVPASTNTSNYANKNGTILITDKVTFKVYKEETTEVQNVCTYLKKGECKTRKGNVYIKHERQYPKKTPADSQLICCILPFLPLPTKEPSKVHLTNDLTDKRIKRSATTGDMSTALKQRNALMRRKFPTPIRKVKPPTSSAPAKVTHKIVTPEDDYIDPYANIKNSNFKKMYVPNNSHGTEYGHGSQDYVEDYVVELPRPGLVGLYSDHGSDSSWMYVGSEITDFPYSTVPDLNDEDGDDAIPGYSTFDPRIVDRVAIGTAKTPKRTPLTFATDSSDEISYDVQSHTVDYQAHPDFHVLQGFKLINLMRNSSRIYSKNGRRTTTTERMADSSECIQTRPILSSVEHSEYDDVFDVNGDIFEDCGKAVKDPLKECEQDKQAGEADVGTHPWLALVVLTKSPRHVSCYATLVHPRAAVTAADCVYGTSPGELTVIAGTWDLESDGSVRPQQRMAQTHVDPRYKPDNLAMLHWKRHLKLSVSVQPACLADPHVGDACKFVGWGGYDQGIRNRPRWQRASILTPRQCHEILSSDHRANLPSDAFCAAIESRASVTGVGGPLTCNVGGRHAAVGVTVRRAGAGALILIPAQEWAAQAVAALHLL